MPCRGLDHDLDRKGARLAEIQRQVEGIPRRWRAVDVRKPDMDPQGASDSGLPGASTRVDGHCSVPSFADRNRTLPAMVELTPTI